MCNRQRLTELFEIVEINYRWKRKRNPSPITFGSYGNGNGEDCHIALATLSLNSIVLGLQDSITTSRITPRFDCLTATMQLTSLEYGVQSICLKIWLLIAEIYWLISSRCCEASELDWVLSECALKDKHRQSTKSWIEFLIMSVVLIAV